MRARVTRERALALKDIRRILYLWRRALIVWPRKGAGSRYDVTMTGVASWIDRNVWPSDGAGLETAGYQAAAKTRKSLAAAVERLARC